MVRIRLARGGRKKSPFYRIVAIDQRRKIKGKSLDVLGFWNPVKDEMEIDQKKLKEWLEKGAQISDGVRKLLEK